MAERQYGKYFTDIRSDHTERYEYASEKVSGTVLDAACGCGYGSYMMCHKNKSIAVTGVDISREAIDFAKITWKHERNNFALWDLDKVAAAQVFDWLICFETIEHLENPEVFLKTISRSCKKFICSVPNQAAIPYRPEKYPYHYRHYTVSEVVELLNKCGFGVTNAFYQKDAYAKGFNTKGGRTIVLEGVSNNFIRNN